VVKQVKRVKSGSSVSYLFPLAGVALPLFFAIFYLPQANYVPNVVTKLLSLAVAPILVVVALFSFKQWGKVAFPRNLTIAFSAFIGYLLFRAAISGSLWQGFVGTSDRNLGILTYLVFFLFTWIGFQLTESAKPKTFVHLLTLVGVGEASIANYQYFAGEKSVAITGTFYNSNPVSFLLGIIAASLFAFLVYEKKRSTAEYLILVFSQLWILIALYFCGSQQGLIIFGLIAVVLVITKLIRVLRVNFAKILFPTFVIALATFSTAVFVIPIKDNSQIAANAFLERLEIYKSALKITIQYPFFGVGVDSFHEKYGQVTLTTLMQLADNAHSVPLHLLSTLGFIGLAIWLAVIFLVFSNGKSGVNEDQAEFKFFQVGFFSYLLIGIVGIEHPVIGAISWLMAGVLIRLSSNHLVEKKSEKPNLVPIKLEKRGILVGSVALVSISLYLLPQQIVVGKALTDFSERTLNNPEYDIIIAENLNRIWNPALLLTTGEAYIAIDQQINALVIANVMLKKYPDDQRTSILLFAIANKWNDDKARKLAEEVRDRIFK
jgi:O-antigen ligase